MYPAGSPVEIGDVCTGVNERLDGDFVQKYWSVRDNAGVVPVAQLPLQAPRFFLPVTLGKPRDGWTRNVPAKTGGACNPPNPNVTSFRDVLTPGGPGVHLDALSATSQCCSCIAETTVFPLLSPLNTDDVMLRGSWFNATRGPQDKFSVAGLGVRLLNKRAPIRGASQTLVAEIRANNNCAGGFSKQVKLANGAPFALPLTSVAANKRFDAIEFSLLSYACGQAANSVEVAGLQVVLS